MSEVLPVVYLARHGETAWSLSGRHTGLTDLPLTERGEEHARLPGERLRGLALGRVLTSPRERAARTGELAGLGSAARVDHDLVERERPRRGDPVKAKRPRILVVDIGGTHVKLRATGQGAPRRFDSGPTLTPKAMIAGVRKLTRTWPHDVVSIGYPGPVLHGRPAQEPQNLARGWVGFDYEAAFGCPVKILNDAAMQALGSYEGGRMLFLGLGTGLGSTLIIEGIVHPLELGHLPYRKGTFEDYVGQRGLQKRGKKRWRRAVEDVVTRLVIAIQPDTVVIGGGNVKKLKTLPPGCRAGLNANAFRGGFRLWERERDVTKGKR